MRDGREVPVDLIILAIGYKVSFPFMDSSLILDEQGRPKLYLNAFHPDYDNLFVAGLLQPNSGLWGLVDYQAQLMAAYITAQEQNLVAVEGFNRLKRLDRPDLSHGIAFVESPRHALEVEYFSYRQRLQKLLKRFAASAKTRATVAAANRP